MPGDDVDAPSGSLYRCAKVDEGIAALREAVAREDKLRYDEPPDCIQPVRHALGAALLQAYLCLPGV